MRYYADLHVHSKYSRACSRDCDVRNLAWWARRKGITVLGTGDFTHPAWAQELRETLEPAEPGLFKLRDDVDAEVLRKLPPSCHGEVRFVLEVEISTIYKRDDRTRKVHHLCYVPSFEAADQFTAALAKIGNLGSDGRPILGLDSRDLLEITLESGEGSYLVPAHVWTPWFAVLGSKSGFDAVADCYVDLADEIFAVETGLSSDPYMNWRVSGLDSYTLVSNSDAHSPPILGRNATVFDTELSYFALRDALRGGGGYVGTVDMFPEEGKYFLDGHRKCDVRMEPEETKRHGLLCPTCNKPLTVGVLHRVEELADRDAGVRPANAGSAWSIVPLPEIIGEILKVGPKSKAVTKAVDELVGLHGPELPMLMEIPLEEIKDAKVHKAISRLRAGQVRCDPGFDGEYGVISLFGKGELDAPTDQVPGLFDMPVVEEVIVPRRVVKTKPTVDTPAAAEPVVVKPAGALLDGLDPDQRAAASIVEGQLLIVAGPGTGKTRTLTHRIAHLVSDHDVAPENCLAITFTRRAAEEMRERLAALVDGDVTVATFHQFGLRILREQHAVLGLAPDFSVADESTRLSVLREILGDEAPGLRKALEDISRVKRTVAAGLAASAAGELPMGEEIDGDLIGLVERYDKAMTSRDLVDFDDLLAMPVTLLSRQIDLVEHYRARYKWICVDEYQDVDELQYRLLQELTPPHGNLCAIGDPDQAIYSFRGSDVGFFLRFQRDYPNARTVQLTRNYRSSPVIVAGAVAAIKPSTLVPDRDLQAMREGGQRIGIYPAASEDAEAQFVVQTIEELLGGSSFHSRDSGRVSGDGVQGGLSFDDIAVLYRTDAQARPVMEALSREGLPFQKRSHSPLSKHAGVQELLKHFVPGPAETMSLLRQAAACADPSLGDEVSDALELLAPLASKRSPESFVAELTLGAEVDTWDPRANRISLLTLHASKGLEFPVVFIVGCAAGVLPIQWATEDDEERRLFFVGVSRAQTHLYLSHRGEPSPFLRALHDDRLVERLVGKTSQRSRQLRLL
ncbi:UvrD-helicase domain-containing protein [Actinocrispum sp. NPDC049592]|uniref:UvrD-helicase domain-containing protein n=1 Tax=Actinocrispum sp. NPDC049592 TaxID=3154835 RepID=UPI0034166B17